MTRFLSDRRMVTYNLEVEVLTAAKQCNTREEVMGIIRANGHMVSIPVQRQLEAIAESKPETRRYTAPEISLASQPKGCSGGGYVWQETGTTAADEAHWLDPWGK